MLLAGVGYYFWKQQQTQVNVQLPPLTLPPVQPLFPAGCNMFDSSGCPPGMQT